MDNMNTRQPNNVISLSARRPPGLVKSLMRYLLGLLWKQDTTSKEVEKCVSISDVVKRF